jgi:hypothetical protein
MLKSNKYNTSDTSKTWRKEKGTLVKALNASLSAMDEKLDKLYVKYAKAREKRLEAKKSYEHDYDDMLKHTVKTIDNFQHAINANNITEKGPAILVENDNLYKVASFHMHEQAAYVGNMGKHITQFVACLKKERKIYEKIILTINGIVYIRDKREQLINELREQNIKNTH